MERTINSVPEGAGIKTVGCLGGLIALVLIAAGIAIIALKSLASPIVHGPGANPNAMALIPKDVPTAAWGVPFEWVLILAGVVVIFIVRVLGKLYSG